MTNRFALSFFIGAFALLALSAQAQVTFRVGPRVGLNIATTRFAPDESYPGAVTTSRTSARPGFEAGVVASLGFGHFQLQPAVLYSQKGFHVQGTQSNVIGTDGTQPAPYQQANRMSYLAVPLNVAYARHKNGQGFQVFAGPYLGILVGGNYRFTRPSTAAVVEVAGAIKGGKRPTDYNGFTDRTLYSQRVDAGMQAGIGYQWGPALLQATYSAGLRNLAPDDFATYAFLGNGPDYRNRVVHVSLAYLVGPKSE
jgi:hypothetical protein